MNQNHSCYRYTIGQKWQLRVDGIRCEQSCQGLPVGKFSLIAGGPLVSEGGLRTMRRFGCFPDQTSRMVSIRTRRDRE